MLVVAGSETIATALSAATYYLAINRESLEKLVAEVTSAFKSEKEINMLNVQKLAYLRAVIDESLRMYPPVVASGPRITGEAGDTILGHHVPPGVS
jgi:cytochrome P450